MSLQPYLKQRIMKQTRNKPVVRAMVLGNLYCRDLFIKVVLVGDTVALNIWHIRPNLTIIQTNRVII